jgi:hypothetical protein
MECEDDVVRVRPRLWIRHSVATPTLRKTSATPCWSGYGDTSSFGSLKPGTGLCGRLALPWTMTSPMLRQRVFIYVHYSFTSCEFFPRPTAAAGNYACACHGRSLTLGTTSPWRPEASSLWRQNCLFSSSCWLRLGDTRPGPRQNFALLRLNRRWSSYLPYAAADLRHLCIFMTYRDHLLHPYRHRHHHHPSPV